MIVIYEIYLQAKRKDDSILSKEVHKLSYQVAIRQMQIILYIR